MSSNSSGRKNTLYDLSGLRLPEGTETRRVQIAEPSGRRARPTTRPQRTKDLAGNWIAPNAAGPSHIPIFRPTRGPGRQDDDAGQGDDDLGEGEQHASEHTADVTSSNEPGAQKRKAESDDKSSKKRKFTQELDYLVRQAQTATGDDSRTLPSAELLKVIHHRAASFYDEQGMLLNCSQQYRRDKKARKLARTGGTNKGKAKATPRTKNGATESVGSDSDLSLSEDNDSENDNVENSDGKRKQSGRNRDMYRVLDGSALMALGVIIQQFVRYHAEERPPPDGWEEIAGPDPESDNNPDPGGSVSPSQDSEEDHRVEEKNEEEDGDDEDDQEAEEEDDQEAEEEDDQEAEEESSDEDNRP
ncbi:hypothetical protein FA15DRAFT_652456 [Coprinopsis marcescibilis]|uniref:Uncharacterized protein n=1 Tax=Coprinopsis marcescibilis TaxID=230819 RepID=A0A5C3L980_COPMA|nr:hypothetical protein FA15DRAFT_652456 [Coprinopsis marcescibilis]